MVSVDNIIEPQALFIWNKYTQCTSHDWVSGTSYGFREIRYDTPLIPNHLYYLSWSYKFTTTNQSPSWASFYMLGGNQSGPRMSNLTAGTEYSASKLQTPNASGMLDTLRLGILYNGPSSNIKGVTSYSKDVVIYDVTELYTILKANGTVTTTAQLLTWCDTNLPKLLTGEKFSLSELISDPEKVIINNGTILASDFTETDGILPMGATSNLNTDLNKLYLNGISGLSVYNNLSGGAVTHTFVDADEQDSPFKNQYTKILKITTNGTASPGAGGFLAYHFAKADHYFFETFVAKVPVGYSVNAAWNSQGTGYTVTWLTSQKGTGKWEQYSLLYHCGTSGTFSSGGHIYLSGSNNTSVTWYVAFATNIDITDKVDLQALPALPNLLHFKGGNCLAHAFNESIYIPNFNFHSNNTGMLPLNTIYDDEDYPQGVGAYRSIVQPVGNGSPQLQYWIPIDPSARYQISYWVKCKRDMSSFLTAIQYQASDGTILRHTNTLYVKGTKTQLAQDLKDGDTTVYLNSVKNWEIRSYSNLSFRESYYATHHQFSYSNGSKGLISSINTTDNSITLAKPYSGDTVAAKTWVVEGQDGGAYPYPIGKNSLPTDNTWKYVKGYFGHDGAVGDGATTGGWGETAIPLDVVSCKVLLNIYGNDGTVPIKYANIKIEQVGKQGGHKLDNKIQIQRLNY